MGFIKRVKSDGVRCRPTQSDKTEPEMKSKDIWTLLKKQYKSGRISESERDDRFG